MDPEKLNQLQSLFSEERFDDAIALLRSAIKTEPKDWNAVYLCGFAFRAKGDFATAIKHYEAALAIEPESETILNALGIAYQHSGRLADAELCFRTALSRNPNRFESLNSLALTLKVRGEFVEALEVYQRAADLCINRAFQEILKDEESYFTFEDQGGERLFRIKPAYFETMRGFLETDLNYFTVVGNMATCCSAVGEHERAAELRAVADNCTPVDADLIAVFKAS